MKVFDEQEKTTFLSTDDVIDSTLRTLNPNAIF